MILLDIVMPDMDGITVYQALQNNPDTQNIPVIFLTAKVKASDLKKFAQLVVVGTIAKSFEPLMIADRITQFLNW